MNPFCQLQEVSFQNLLIVFYDIKGFTSAVSKKLEFQSLQGFLLMDGMAKLVIDCIEQTNGLLVKFIGDAALIVFSEDDVDDGVLCMLDMKEELERYFKEQNFDVKFLFGLHYGEAAIGPFGKEPYLSIDVLGDNVNMAARVAQGRQKSNFVISPQVFRKLKPETRKRFHKFTPPIVYTAENT